MVILIFQLQPANPLATMKFKFFYIFGWRCWHMVSIQYSVKLVFYTFLMWCNLTVIKTLLYLWTCFLGSHTKLRFLNGYLLYRAKPAPWYRDFFSNDIMYSVAAKRVWNRARQFFSITFHHYWWHHFLWLTSEGRCTVISFLFFC